MDRFERDKCKRIADDMRKNARVRTPFTGAEVCFSIGCDHDCDADDREGLAALVDPGDAADVDADALLELASALDGARCACEYFGHRGDSCGGCPAESAADCTAAVRRDAARRIRECVGDAAVGGLNGAVAQKTDYPQSECGNDTADAPTAFHAMDESDRTALEWVRSLGGLDGARDRMGHLAGRAEVAGRVAKILGVDTRRHEGFGAEVMDSLSARLMPSGMEWPRFEETPMDNYNGEEWRPVKGFGGKYEVSNYGRVRSIDHEMKSLGGYRTVRGRILKQRVEHGYCRVQLSISKNEHPHKQVHRLVAEAFVPNPDNKPEVNHIDGCKTNNCANNLEWVTSSENSVRALENGLQKPRTEEELQKMWDASSKPVIRDDGEWYESASKAAEAIGAERSSVAKAIRRGGSIYGHTYQYADDEEHPSVLAADGEQLEVGQTVWSVNDGKQFEVVNINDGLPLLKFGETGYTATEPENLTHQRPVLDADGVPIKVGDTVYWGRHIAACTVVSPYRERDNAGYDLTASEHTVEIRVGDNDTSLYVHPESLTHTKPEPPDSWELLEMEAASYGAAAYCDKHPDAKEIQTDLTMWDRKAIHLVRRCKALAERGE